MLSARTIADLLRRDRPTDEQAAVIEGDLGPALVVAGAGSGKTETMAGRVVWLLANGLVDAVNSQPLSAGDQIPSVTCPAVTSNPPGISRSTGSPSVSR